MSRDYVQTEQEEAAVAAAADNEDKTWRQFNVIDPGTNLLCNCAARRPSSSHQRTNTDGCNLELVLLLLLVVLYVVFTSPEPGSSSSNSNRGMNGHRVIRLLYYLWITDFMGVIRVAELLKIQTDTHTHTQYYMQFTKRNANWSSTDRSFDRSERSGDRAAIVISPYNL